MAGSVTDAEQAQTQSFPGGQMRARNHFALSAYWFATNLHWMALLQVVLPKQVSVIAPERQALMLSLILGCGSVIALILPPVVGSFSDRCASRWGRRRPYMVVGVAVNLLGLAVLFAAGVFGSIWLYLLGYLVVQIGNNSATASYSGIIPDLVLEKQRGIASGWMAAMTQAGSVTGAFGAGMLMGGGHVGSTYLLIGTALVIFLSITAMGVRERPLAEPAPPIPLRDLLRSMWIDPRRYPDFAWVWITRFLFTLGMWMVQPFIQYYLRDVVGVANPAEQTGYVLGVALIGATVTGLLGGGLSDRIGRKRVVYLANGMMAVTSIGFLFAHSLSTVYVVGIVYGLGFGAYYSVDWALGCDVLPNKEGAAAKDMGVWHIAMVLPQSFAPFLGGLVLSACGHTSVPGPAGPLVHYVNLGYTVTFSAAAFFLVVSAVLLRNVRGVR